MSTGAISSPPFRVPQHGHGFPAEIVARCSDLIAGGIWSGIKTVRLRRWMRNFTTDEERYFAACVADALIYRSDEQTTALVLQLFQRSLVDLVRLSPLPRSPIDDWLQLLRGPSSPIRLVAAVKRSDPTHKSAHLVSRLMKRQLSVRQQWIAKPWELDQHIKTGAQVLVFIDDFLGTGQQFEELFTQEHLDWIFSAAYVVYAPFVAHAQGLDYLRHKYPHLHVTAAEVLDGKHELFSAESHAFDDGVNTPGSASDFYCTLLKNKGIALDGDDRFGFGGRGLTYVFEHAVPDNNLPLLWWPSVREWFPLFDR